MDGEAHVRNSREALARASVADMFAVGTVLNRGDEVMLMRFVVLVACLAGVAAPLRALAQADAPIGPDEGRPRVSWQNAGNVIGQIAFVFGRVTDVGQTERICFINFDGGTRAGFVAVVFNDAWANFPRPLKELYEGRIVRIRGFVSEYGGRPQIVITRPGQVEVLSELPAGDVGSVAAARPMPNRNQVAVATFNVLNLFDGDDDPYYADETTAAKPRAELERLAGTIRRLDADLLALQEVENRGYLERFLQVFLSDMGYEVVHFEGNDMRGIDVCLLSRLPVGRVISHRHLRFTGPNGDPRRFSRDVLVATIEPPGAQSLDLWVVHLKSNSDGRAHAEPIRLAEARQLRRLLDDALRADPAARIIVAGDFNDTWQSGTLRTIVGSGDAALWSASQNAESRDLITYNQEPYLSMIDFILGSPAIASDYVHGSFAVRPGSPQISGSDHNPVVARFELKRSAPSQNEEPTPRRPD
jgi:endonuclease/exonuclease/phosphatase family metal-dependent hydrolase